MALKQTLEKINHDHIIFRCKTVAAKGTLLSYSTIDDGFVEKISGSPSVLTTKAAGLLLINVVNRAVPSNLTVLGDDTGTVNLPRNFNRNETNVSGIVRLLVHGYTESDQLDPVATFGQGSGLFIGDNGLLTTAPLTVSGVGTAQKVGHALSGKRDGFVRVFINIT